MAFLPVEFAAAGPRPAAAPAASDHLRVGTFGTGGDSKRLEVVAKALALISRTRPVRLSVAGWAAARHCRATGIASLPFVEVHDGVDEPQLDALMRGVDVAVQLRVPTHGESSGAVARLLGLGRQVVVTGEGSFTELPPALVTCVPADCQPAQLAAAIEAAAARGLTAAALREALEPFSPQAFAERIAGVLGGESRAEVARPSRLSA